MRHEKILGALRFPMLLTASLAMGYYAAPVVSGQYHRWFPPPAYVTGDFSGFYAAAEASVVLFSDSKCQWCRRTREYLQMRGVPYREYLVDRSVEAATMHARLDAPAVPVVLIGERKIVGYREEAFAEALSAAGLEVSR